MAARAGNRSAEDVRQSRKCREIVRTCDLPSRMTLQALITRLSETSKPSSRQIQGRFEADRWNDHCNFTFQSRLLTSVNLHILSGNFTRSILMLLDCLCTHGSYAADEPLRTIRREGMPGKRRARGSIGSRKHCRIFGWEPGKWASNFLTQFFPAPR